MNSFLGITRVQIYGSVTNGRSLPLSYPEGPPHSDSRPQAPYSHSLTTGSPVLTTTATDVVPSPGEAGRDVIPPQPGYHGDAGRLGGEAEGAAAAAVVGEVGSPLTGIRRETETLSDQTDQLSVPETPADLVDRSTEMTALSASPAADRSAFLPHDSMTCSPLTSQEQLIQVRTSTYTCKLRAAIESVGYVFLIAVS